MTHSIQTMGDASEIINDLDLVATIGLLSREFEKDPIRHARMEPWIRGWLEQSSNYAPGTIDLELEDIAASAEDRTALVDLLDALEAELARLGPVVPGPLLDDMKLSAGMVFGDYPVEYMVDVVSRVRRLLRLSP